MYYTRSACYTIQEARCYICIPFGFSMEVKQAIQQSDNEENKWHKTYKKGVLSTRKQLGSRWSLVYHIGIQKEHLLDYICIDNINTAKRTTSNHTLGSIIFLHIASTQPVTCINIDSTCPYIWKTANANAC